MSEAKGKGGQPQVTTADGLMRRDPETYDKEVNGEVLATHLVKRWAGAVTIVDDQGKPVGIVTEYDLLNAVKEGRFLSSLSAQQLMTQPVTVSEKTSLSEILDMLVTGHLIHLPVVDHEEKLVGLIERRDVLSACLVSTP